MRPSFLGHALGGFLLGLATVYLIAALWHNRQAMTYNDVATLLLLFSIATTLHGLSHLAEERYFAYNPLRDGNLLARDDPVR